MVACAVPVRAQQAAGQDTGWGLTVALQRYFIDRIMPFLRYSYSDGGATPMNHLVTGGIGYRVKGHNGTRT
jgi:hypothetical protein